MPPTVIVCAPESMLEKAGPMLAAIKKRMQGALTFKELQKPIEAVSVYKELSHDPARGVICFFVGSKFFSTARDPFSASLFQIIQDNKVASFGFGRSSQCDKIGRKYHWFMGSESDIDVPGTVDRLNRLLDGEFTENNFIGKPFRQKRASAPSTMGAPYGVYGGMGGGQGMMGGMGGGGMHAANAMTAPAGMMAPLGSMGGMGGMSMGRGSMNAGGSPRGMPSASFNASMQGGNHFNSTGSNMRISDPPSPSMGMHSPNASFNHIPSFNMNPSYHMNSNQMNNSMPYNPPGLITGNSVIRSPSSGHISTGPLVTEIEPIKSVVDTVEQMLGHQNASQEDVIKYLAKEVQRLTTLLYQQRGM